MAFRNRLTRTSRSAPRTLSKSWYTTNIRTEIHSPYEWELGAYMMDDAQRSWADQSPAAEYRNVLPPTESIEAWKRRMAYDPALMEVYTAKLDELRKNYV